MCPSKSTSCNFSCHDKNAVLRCDNSTNDLSYTKSLRYVLTVYVFSKHLIRIPNTEKAVMFEVLTVLFVAS
jgi:hypothetical protein